MCGIFGFVKCGNVPESNLVACMSTLALQNVARGRDSWGIFFHDASGTCFVQRGLGKVIHADIVNACQQRTLACHTRWKTVGEITLDNAHPFSFDNILGSHNGGVFSHEKLNKQYNVNLSCDSMHIFRHLAEQRNLKELEGYGAIEYTDLNKPYSIFLATWPVCELTAYRVKFSKRDMVIVWSSEQEHIEASLQMAAWKKRAKEITIPSNRIVEITGCKVNYGGAFNVTNSYGYRKRIPVVYPSWVNDYSCGAESGAFGTPDVWDDTEVNDLELRTRRMRNVRYRERYHLSGYKNS